MCGSAVGAYPSASFAQGQGQSRVVLPFLTASDRCGTHCISNVDSDSRSSRRSRQTGFAHRVGEYRRKSGCPQFKPDGSRGSEGVSEGR